MYNLHLKMKHSRLRQAQACIPVAARSVSSWLSRTLSSAAVNLLQADESNISNKGTKTWF